MVDQEGIPRFPNIPTISQGDSSRQGWQITLVDKQKKPQQQTGHSLFIPIYIQYLYYSRNLEQTASTPDFQSQRLSIYAASPPLYPSASSSVKLQDP